MEDIFSDKVIELDILNIVDDFLNRRSLNFGDIVRQLNENNDPELIAKKYQLDSHLLIKKLTEAGYRFNEQQNKWIHYSQEDKSLSISQGEPMENADFSSHISDVDIEHIVRELNSGTEINDLANKLGISNTDLFTLLNKNNYFYYDFANLWTKLTEKELVREFVTQLNRGFTIYDLSAKYTTNKTARIQFVNTLENLLARYSFVYNEKLKRWVIAGDNQSITSGIVALLNKGTSFQEIERIYNISRTNIRMLLKEHNYRYDHMYNIWTDKSQEQLLRDTAKELSLNNKTWEDFIIEKNIDRKLLYRKLKAYNLEKLPLSFQEENETKDSLENDSVEIISNNDSPTLSSEEIRIIKLIIQEWKEKSTLSSNNSLVELKIYLPRNLLHQLESYCELNSVNKSNLIQKLLEEYFKTI